MGRISDRFDLEQQMIFYLSYHYNKINKYIHFTCIWPILFTSFMLVADTNPHLEQPAFFASLPLGKYLVLNFSALGAVIYMAWYIALDHVAGSLAAVLVFIAYVFGNYFSQTAPSAFGVSAWEIALPIFIVLWIAQFIGHGVFERRKPALLDSFDQALITAPLFVLLEFLFMFGYRKEFHDRVMIQVRINVLAFHGKEAFEKTFGESETTPLIARAH